MIDDNKKKGSIDLVREPILTALSRLAAPIMASMLLSTVYNITDMAWVGLLGASEVTAVGVVGMYLWLASGLSTLPRMGGQIMVAQEIGSNHRDRAGEYARASLQMTVFLGILYAIIAICFMKPLIGFFQLTNPETISSCMQYMTVTCGLVIFSFLTSTLTGISNAQGDSRTPFIANLIGLATNMILDPVLIFGVGPFPKLGVLGAAVATVTAQIIVSTVIICRIMGKPAEDNVLKHRSLLTLSATHYYSKIVKLGFPTALDNMVYCGISFVLSRMVTDYGEGAIAVQRVGSQIESVCWNVSDGCASALNAFTAQNYGARRLDRMKKGYFISAKLLFAWGLFITLIFFFVPGPIASVFFHQPDIVLMAKDYLRIISFGEAFMCIEILTIGGMSGVGKTLLAGGISMVLTALRIPLAFFLSHTSLGLDGIWWAFTLSSVLKGIIYFIAMIYLFKILTSQLSDDSI